MAARLVAYYRVSTAKQGASGLGLEGQEAAVAAYAKSNNFVLLRSYTEVETGKRSDRPELARRWPTASCRGPPWSSPSSIDYPGTSIS